MRIQHIDSSPSSKGLYFTRVSNVLFNKNHNINYVTKDAVKYSENGYRYIEDRTITKEVKERFSFMPFVRELSKKFDTFVFFSELPKGHPNNLGNTHFSFARITWADSTKGHNELRVVSGNSPVSQECATKAMFDNLSKKQFSEIR